jgi:fructokinase
MYKIGIDLGGTKIEGIILNGDDQEVTRKRILTEREKGYEHILDNIASVYRDLANHIDQAPHTLGMGTPGAISPKTGLLKNSNTVIMNGKPVKRDLQQRFGRDFELQNDANCFAMAEARHGAGKGKDMVFGVIMGTGCGGGLVHHGKVHTGIQAIGGEWGHMSIDPNGPKCYCGANGCVETYISGGQLTKRYNARYGENKTSLEIEKAYYAGDHHAVEMMEEFFVHFGRAMANLITILDPDVVVLGGGFSKFKDIYTKGVKEVERQVFSDSLETPILQHQIGDSAGVLGAAYIGI